MTTSTISKLTRRNLLDDLKLRGIPWWGRLDEIQFLGRLYDLESLPSTDTRFDTAAGDIWQHRVANDDWDDDWVFSDDRFGLGTGSDEEYLNSLCEMVHPIVRRDVEEVVALINQHLPGDGWELYEMTQISGHPVFAARRCGSVLHDPAQSTGKLAAGLGQTEYIMKQINRMNAAVEDDPGLAIGTAKEMVETVCKSILQARGVSIDQSWDVPALVKATCKELTLIPAQVPDAKKGAEAIRLLLQNLSMVPTRLAEIRNLYGTGHGKDASTTGVNARHAHLAAGAATTVSVFLWETHLQRNGGDAGPDRSEKA